MSYYGLDDDITVLSENDLEDQFIEYMDEVYPPIDHMGAIVDAAAIKVLDPILFRQAFLDWLDMQQSEGVLEYIEDKNYYIYKD